MADRPDGPQPGDLILHYCCGRPSAWQPAGEEGRCDTCHATLLPDQPYRSGHVAILCEDCHELVGLCGGEVDEEVVHAVGAMLEGANRARP